MKKTMLTLGALLLSTTLLFAAGSAVPYYLPIFNAIEKGYFTEEGLEVNYMVGNVEFGFPNGEPIIVAQSQDIPVVVVHSTLQQGLGGEKDDFHDKGRRSRYSYEREHADGPFY